MTTTDFESPLDLGIDCSPSNPGCEYSEENIGPDPWSPTRTICLAHNDQIEAALAQAREAELAAATPAPYDPERPF